MKVSLQVRNASGVAANFQAADARLQRAVRQAVRKAGLEVQKRAKELAPVDTGFLRDHIRVDFTREGLSYRVGWRGEEFANAGRAPYFLYTELGTTRTPARPCLFPAQESVRPQFRAELRKAIRDALRRGRGQR